MSQRNTNNIKELRQTLGLSQRNLAEEVGVWRDTVRHWEKGEQKPQGRFKDRLNEIFDDEITFGPPAPALEPDPTKPKPQLKTKEFYEQEEAKLKEIQRSRESVKRTFTVGKNYMILTAPHDADDPLHPILRYEGKKGIHHVFREVRGEWIVTYTDAQLVGKTAKEAKE